MVTEISLIQGQEVAEKINASPQNSAFEFRTLQDSAACLLNHIPKHGAFLLETEMLLVVALSLGQQNENISRLNLPTWANNQYNRKGGFHI